MFSNERTRVYALVFSWLSAIALSALASAQFTVPYDSARVICLAVAVCISIAYTVLGPWVPEKTDDDTIFIIIGLLSFISSMAVASACMPIASDQGYGSCLYTVIAAAIQVAVFVFWRRWFT
jgi:hypothetical protein